MSEPKLVEEFFGDLVIVDSLEEGVLKEARILDFNKVDQKHTEVLNSSCLYDAKKFGIQRAKQLGFDYVFLDKLSSTSLGVGTGIERSSSLMLENKYLAVFYKNK